MSKTAKNSPSFLTVLIHTFMVLITGGFWLIPLGIYYGLKIANNK